MRKKIGSILTFSLLVVIFFLSYPLFKVICFQLKVQTDRAIVSPKEQSGLAQSTIDLFGPDSSIGRGYLDVTNNSISTNFHVLHAYCDSLPRGTCTGQKILVSLATNPGMKLPVRVSDAFCIEWLDICMIRSNELNLLTTSEQHAEAEPNPSILNLSSDDDDQKVYRLQGARKYEGRLISILSIPTRSGMSGSPIYAGKQFLGIATSNFLDFNLLNYVIFKKIWSKYHRIYSPLTVVLNRQTLVRLNSCLGALEAECQAVLQGLVLESSRDFVELIRSENLTKMQKIPVFNRFHFKKSALQEIKNVSLLSEATDLCHAAEQTKMLEMAIGFFETLGGRDGLSRFKPCTLSRAEQTFLNDLTDSLTHKESFL